MAETRYKLSKAQVEQVKAQAQALGDATRERDRAQAVLNGTMALLADFHGFKLEEVTGLDDQTGELVVGTPDKKPQLRAVRGAKATAGKRGREDTKPAAAAAPARAPTPA